MTEEIKMEPYHKGDLEALLMAAFSAGAGHTFANTMKGEDLERWLEYSKTPAPRSTFQRVEHQVAVCRQELEAEIRRLKFQLKLLTGNAIGFTFEPTGERVTLYSDSNRSFQILAAHPEVLQMIVAASEPLDFKDSTHGVPE